MLNIGLLFRTITQKAWGKLFLGIVLFSLGWLTLSTFATRPLIITGTSYLDEGQHDAAIKYLSIATWISPNSPYTFYNRGNAYLIAEEYEAAFSDFDKAIKVDAGFKEAYLGRCIAENSLASFDAAIEDCTKALELGLDVGDKAAAHYNRGISYMYVEKYDLALLDFQQANNIRETALVDCLIGIIYFEKKNSPEESIQYFKDGIALDTEGKLITCRSSLEKAQQSIENQ